MPTDATCADGDIVDTSAETADVGPLGIRAAAVDDPAGPSLQREAALLTQDAKRQAWLVKVGAKMIASTQLSGAEVRTKDVRAKVFPVPEFLRTR